MTNELTATPEKKMNAKKNRGDAPDWKTQPTTWMESAKNSSVRDQLAPSVSFRISFSARAMVVNIGRFGHWTPVQPQSDSALAADEGPRAGTGLMAADRASAVSVVP